MTMVAMQLKMKMKRNRGNGGNEKMKLTEYILTNSESQVVQPEN